MVGSFAPAAREFIKRRIICRIPRRVTISLNRRTSNDAKEVEDLHVPFGVT
jgi:hypothetical protein